jgi:hypothetical protein
MRETNVPVQLRAARTIRATEAIHMIYGKWTNNAGRYHAWPASAPVDDVLKRWLERAHADYRSIEEGVLALESAERQARASKVAEYAEMAEARSKRLSEMLNTQTSANSTAAQRPVF